MKRFLIVFFFLLLSFADWSCSHKNLNIAKPAYANAGKYYTFPSVQGVSSELDQVARSIYRLSVIAFYESYTFDRKAGITLQKFKTEDVARLAISHTVSSQSVLGTASVVYADNEKAVLLTCAHVVNFPDTSIIYYPDASGFIRNISIKIKQVSYVSGLSNPDVKLLATDDKHDIALLQARVSPLENIRVMPFPTGKASDLDWGSFIYVMGFPNGRKMVESGIVSKPERNKTGFFLSNAMFNPGISGGPVFAILHGTAGLEWVGMASSSSATNIFYVEPDINQADFYSKTEPYKGVLHINKKKMITYGVTFSVSMEEIIRFVASIKTKLEKEGFDTQQFFYHQP